MAYHDWHVGMKVVCVDGNPGFVGHDRSLLPGEQFPIEGVVYTIREIGLLYPASVTRNVLVRLNEIVLPAMRYLQVARPYEGAFLASRFRPVQERKTDISVFTAMLNPQSEVVDA